MQFIRGEALGEKEASTGRDGQESSASKCHTTISRGHSLEEVKKTCVQCHDATYGKMTDEWQQEVSDRIKRLKLSLEAYQRSRRMPGSGSERKKVEALVKEVNELLRVVEEDKSKGVHNFVYAQEIDRPRQRRRFSRSGVPSQTSFGLTDIL